MKRALLTVLCLAGCASAPPAERPAWAAAFERLPARPPPEAYRSGVRLHCTPDDATLSVDGVPKGLCSDFARVPAQLKGEGKLHLLEVKKQGYQPYQTYFAPSGATVTLTVQLAPQTLSERSPR